MGRLKWWFCFCSSLLALGLSFFFGWAQKLWELDITKIGAGIVVLYFLFSIFIGWLTYLAEKSANNLSYFDQKNSVSRVEAHLKGGWFASELMLGLGMIGTMIGIMVMLSAAFGGDMNVASILSGLKVGLSTVGVTTIIGLVCSFALKIQLVNLEFVLDE